MSEYSAPTQFIDLAAQQRLIRPQLDAAVQRVFDHGQYIMGPEVKQFEDSLREFTGAKHALTCANGTDALTLVLMAWGIGPGDAVFVPSFTYVASAEAPAQLGATPFFVDVYEETFNLDPQSLKQAILDCREIGLRPAVVVAVDLFGQPADVDAITEVAHAEGIKVLVDGAQSFGGSSSGRKVGCMGDATTTSFFPAKPLGCYGDGGAVFTNTDEDAETIGSIRLHGRGSQKYDNARIGLNSRLDTIQAAILIEKFKLFPRELYLRGVVAQNYGDLIEGLCRAPQTPPQIISSWAQYTLRLKNRDHVQRELKKMSVPSVVYYPIPLSEQHGYRHFPSVSSGVSNSELLSKSVLSLPMHPYLQFQEQVKVVSALKAAL